MSGKVSFILKAGLSMSYTYFFIRLIVLVRRLHENLFNRHVSIIYDTILHYAKKEYKNLIWRAL